jgi:hypothetical protein
MYANKSSHKSNWYKGPTTELGQNTVEFALSLLFLLMVVFGIIDFSRAAYSASVIQWAAQEGARAGIVNISNVRPAAESKLVGLDPSQMNVVATQPDTRTVRVEVTYQYHFITPVLPGGVELRGSASMTRH